MDDESYSYLKKTILKLSNINLDDYKDKQMRRRLTTYFEHSNVANVPVFCSMLEKDTSFLQKLLDFITINVSEFYRDTHLFDKLQNVIIPEIVKNTGDINIWSAGCSRGQEPYTLAMILETVFPSIHYRIMATDIDDGALQFARAGGPYTKEDIKNVPEILKNRYFAHSEDKYFVKNDLKTNIRFQKQNLLRDQFHEGFNLIICRNVTIYFTEEAKHDLNVKFHRSLKDDGILFIGGTEVMLDSHRIGFTNIGVCFYKKQVKKQDVTESFTRKIPINV
ncbi:MAG: protein-glutamate O-methyltransferase CheR [Dehalococcoidales bacterium]|nr:protein-glutamate O-methyltransferase CheR [Dehalococcoidales bacterium]